MIVELFTTSGKRNVDTASIPANLDKNTKEWLAQRHKDEQVERYQKIVSLKDAKTEATAANDSDVVTEIQKKIDALV